MVVVAIVGIGLGWLADRIYQQRLTTAFVNANGGTVYYDWWSWSGTPEPPGPRWLRRIAGDELFQEIDGVRLTGGGRFNLHVPTEDVLEWVARRAPRIRNLIIVRCNLSEVAYPAIAKLGALEHLDLLDEEPTDTQISYLSNLTGLKSLDIVKSEGFFLSDRALESLSRLRNLKRLTISIPWLSGRGLEHLSHLKSLEYLDLQARRSDVSVAGLQRVRSISSLETLSFHSRGWHIETQGTRFSEPTPAEAIDKAIEESLGH
jgi:hypothetical protein